jgi:type I restriction-modification system DNA methylase subunit
MAEHGVRMRWRREARKLGREFYTPRSAVRVQVQVFAHNGGRVLYTCCGSGGMFVQSEGPGVQPDHLPLLRVVR